MGGRHVATVYSEWSAVLHDKPMRLLAFMANICRDDDPKPVYWGGRDTLCEAALGRTLPNPNRADEEAAKVRRAAYKALSDTLNVLRSAGAIELLNRPAPGRQAEYLIVLERPRMGHGDRDPLNDPWAVMGHGDRAEQITVTVPMDHGDRVNGSRSPSTRGETNTTNTTGDITRTLALVSPAPVDQLTQREIAIHRSGCTGWVGGYDSAVPCLICKPHLRDRARAAL